MTIYMPLDKVVLSFACKTFKAMTRVNFRAYIIMKLFLWSLMPSYSSR
jgi:hypothetical protein